MDLNDFSKGRIWPIRPESFETIARGFHGIFDIIKNEHGAPGSDPQIIMDGDQPQKDAFFFLPMPPATEEPPYKVEEGTAVIKISGPLSKKTTFFSRLMGGSSYQDVTYAVNMAVNDSQVDAILLDIDSPGGTVSGVQATAEAVFQARQKKPVAAFANGMMTSAAYWIGSAADRIVAEDTADLGSIGVLMVHYDYSVMDARYGIKISYISAGKYKAIGNDAEPLSVEARQIFQNELDYIYSIFIDTIARHRNTSSEEVRGRMADGRIFIGRQALEAGLVDEIGNYQTALAAAADLDPTNSRRIFDMKLENVAQMEEAYPELVSEIRTAAAAAVDTDAECEAAATTEKERLIGLAGVQFGAEAGEKFRAVVDTGVSVEQFTAVRGAAPAAAAGAGEAQARAAALAAIQGAGAENPGGGSPPAAGSKDFMVQVAEHRAANGSSQVEAMQAIIKTDPASHQKYINSVN